MKRLFCALFLALVSFASFAQEQFEGKVIDVWNKHGDMMVPAVNDGRREKLVLEVERDDGKNVLVFVTCDPLALGERIRRNQRVVFKRLDSKSLVPHPVWEGSWALKKTEAYEYVSRARVTQ